MRRNHDFGALVEGYFNGWFVPTRADVVIFMTGSFTLTIDDALGSACYR